MTAFLAFGAVSAQADTVTVFAAASLKESLDIVAADWEQATGNTVTIAYAATSTLARQIAEGAPADIFFAASEDWMDDLSAKGLLRDETRSDVLGNTLVLVAPAPASPIELAQLPAVLGMGKLAMAGVDSVPAGIYGKQALTALGLWDVVSPNVAQADNVRGALALVALGEAPFGVVYATDARAEPKVDMVAMFPSETHDPIIYPAAILTGATSPVAADFMTYLYTTTARLIFAAAGFTAP